MNCSTFRRLVAAGIGCALAGAALAVAPGGGAAARPHAVDEPLIERALAGVSLFIANNSASIATGVTASCPLMTRDQLGWFVGQQGVAPSFDGWAVGLFMYADVGGGAPGVSCGVDIATFAGRPGDGSVGVRLEAVAMPEGTTLHDLLGSVEGSRPLGPGGDQLGGEIGGACHPGGAAVVCVLMWYRSGLAVTTVLAGRSSMVTEQATSTLMASMIPTIVRGLSRYAIDFGPPPTSTTTLPPTIGPTTSGPPPTIAAERVLDVAAARRTLGEFVAAHPVGSSGPEGGALRCPTITAPAVGAAMSAAGLTADVDPFHVTVEDSDVAPGVVAVSCGGDVIGTLEQASLGIVLAFTPRLTAYDLSGPGTGSLRDVLADRPGLVALQADTGSIGGDLFGNPCDVTSGSGTFCVRLWHRDGLVVMLEVAGNVRPDLDAATTRLFTSLVPAAVDNLATHAHWPAPWRDSVVLGPGTVRLR